MGLVQILPRNEYDTTAVEGTDRYAFSIRKLR